MIGETLEGVSDTKPAKVECVHVEAERYRPR